MKKQNSNAVNHEQKADQYAHQNGASKTGEQAAADKESVKATSVDPKNTKHGVNYCCGSCGG